MSELEYRSFQATKLARMRRPKFPTSISLGPVQLRSTNGTSFWGASRWIPMALKTTLSRCSTAPCIGRISRPPIVRPCYLVFGHGSSPTLDTGENPRWDSTEPYYDSFYCNVGPIPPVSAPRGCLLPGSFTVGYVSNVILTYGPSRPRKLLQDRARDA